MNTFEVKPWITRIVFEAGIGGTGLLLNGGRQLIKGGTGLLLNGGRQLIKGGAKVRTTS